MSYFNTTCDRGRNILICHHKSNSVELKVMTMKHKLITVIGALSLFNHSSKRKIVKCRFIRQEDVVAQKGIPVRQEPSSESKTVGFISSGRRVILTGQGTNGWLPISVPFKGYVSSGQLVYCRNFSG